MGYANAMPLLNYDDAKRARVSLYLEPEERAALDGVIAFETALLRATGSRRVSTLNRIIREAIKLFVAQYWHEFGGQPTTPEETREKVARVVKDLRAHQSKKNATSVK